MISNKKKALIHIAMAQTGMTEDEYRDLLSSVGVTSSRDLDGKTFDTVMSRFEALGFKSSAGRKRKTKNLPRDKKKLMSKLEAIILDMGLSWAYVDAISKKRFDVDAAMWLEGEELYKLVQMMVVYQKRQEKRRA